MSRRLQTMFDCYWNLRLWHVISYLFIVRNGFPQRVNFSSKNFQEKNILTVPTWIMCGVTKTLVSVNMC